MDNDKLHQVASALGWKEHKNTAGCTFFHTPWQTTDNPINLAVYAMAEVEKRGMYFNTGLISGFSKKPLITLGGAKGDSISRVYDPTDPDSFADVVMDVIHEALCVKGAPAISKEKADAFISDVLDVYKKHGLALGHEDGHGNFQIERRSDHLDVMLAEARIAEPEGD